jgi:hypothetical protein
MHPPVATGLNKLVLVFAEADGDHASDTFDTVASIEASTERNQVERTTASSSIPTR